MSLKGNSRDQSQASSNNVLKLANVYMGKKSRSLPTSFSQQTLSSSAATEQNRFSLIFPHDLNHLDHEEPSPPSVDELVPIGIVKRQVESINFKIKTSQPDNRTNLSENDFEMIIDNQHKSNLAFGKTIRHLSGNVKLNKIVKFYWQFKINKI